MSENQEEIQETQSESNFTEENIYSDNEIKSFEKAKNELTVIMQEISAVKTSIDSDKSEIDSLKQQINEIFAQINSEREELNSKNIIEELSAEFQKNKDNFETYNKNIEENRQLLKATNDKFINDLDQQLNDLIAEYKNSIATATAEFSNNNQQLKTTLQTAQNNAQTVQEQLITLITKFNSLSEESTQKIKVNLDEAVTNNTEIKKIKSESKTFFESVTQYISDMENTTKKTIDDVKKFEENTQKIISENEKLQEEIKEQLLKATSGRLFHTFEDRKNSLKPGQIMWLIVIFISLAWLGFTSYSISQALVKTDLNNLAWIHDFIIKLTATTPVIYLIVFATQRYAKERRLIEEYAFKSAISLALKPYLDLINEHRDNKDDKYKEFLIDAMKNIFEVPTDKVFKSKEVHTHSVNLGDFDTKAFEFVHHIKSFFQK